MDHNSLNIDQQTVQAYLKTTYTTEKPSLSIKIGEINPALHVFLFDNNSIFWAFISAFNPYSTVLPDEENDLRHQALIEKATSKKMRFREGLGVPADENWKAEKSLLILDISSHQH